MSPIVIRLALSSLLLITGSLRAAADDGPECFGTSATRPNLCAQALDIHQAFAARIPLRMTADVTMSAMVANGPTLLAIAVWAQSKAEIESYLHSGGLSMVDLDGRLIDGTRTAVCNDAAIGAFVRLGGRMRYIYKSSDGFGLSSPEIRECPKPE